MSLLLRVALVWIVLGFILGVVLRRQAGGGRLPLTLGFSLFPVVGHFVYIVVYTLRNTGALAAQLTVFGVLGLGLSGLTYWGLRRYAKTRPSRAALLPLAVSSVYALPLLWFSSALRAQQIGLDAIPGVVLAAATLFASSALLSYLWRFEPGALLRRRK